MLKWGPKHTKHSKEILVSNFLVLHNWAWAHSPLQRSVWINTTTTFIAQETILKNIFVLINNGEYISNYGEDDIMSVIGTTQMSFGCGYVLKGRRCIMPKNEDRPSTQIIDEKQHKENQIPLITPRAQKQV